MAILLFCREAFRSFFGEPSAKDTYVKVGVVFVNVRLSTLVMCVRTCLHADMYVHVHDPSVHVQNLISWLRGSYPFYCAYVHNIHTLKFV